MTETKAAETYTTLSGLMGGGARLADAVRQLATETGRSEAAVRASYYAQRAKLGRTGRDGALTVEDAINEARRLLEQALRQVETELATAKAELDTASERYETVRASAEAQTAELVRKIAALAPPDR